MLRTARRWAAFLWAIDALVWFTAAWLLRVHLAVAAVIVSWIALSVHVTAVLYVSAAGGANPGAVMRGRRWAVLQPVLAPYRLVAYAITCSAWVIRPRLVAIAEVAPGLHVGMRLFPHQVPRLAERGITCVMDMAAELPANGALARADMDRFEMSVLDRCAPTVDEIERATEWASEHIAAGRAVLLHCAFGRGRSAMMAAAVLLRMGKARDVDDAIRQVVRARPEISVKGEQYERLVEFARRR